MAGFVFKLEPVLRQRKADEDEKQRELAKLLRKQMIYLDQLRGMQESITGSKHDLRESLRGAVDLSAVGDFARFNAQCEQRARSIVQQLAGLERQIETQRTQLLEAVKARKAIEMLRDRHYRAWQLQQARREEAALDEVGAQQFIKKMQEVAS